MNDKDSSDSESSEMKLSIDTTQKKNKDKKEKKVKKDKKEKKEKKKVKKEKKEQKRKDQALFNDENPRKKTKSANETVVSVANESPDVTNHSQQETGDPLAQFNRDNPRPFAESSSLLKPEDKDADRCVTLLLFYQYVEPTWNEEQYTHALQKAEELATQHKLSGRMRVAREGFNCTLTSKHRSDMYAFCRSLRDWNEVFYKTEFKFTHDLPSAQAFPQLKVIKVVELVHYGLEGRKAPPIAQYSGIHLEPTHYHKKLAEPNTVVIDVRNHYEAVIGHFQPPTEAGGAEGGAEPPKYIDPKMRKSTEFPAWLDNPETQKELKGKQVLMFCTGGIRCERASALLKYKMATDPVVKDLGIKGVYQLQGGIDKYFKEFPDGGYWKGKNYVFDKRFSHAPLLKEEHVPDAKPDAPISSCEACGKPWDKFRGKQRCYTCGVPSLVCRDCLDSKSKPRCDLCVSQNIKSKREWREKEQREIEEYEKRSKARGVLLAASHAENPDNITRLFLKNMCRKNMTDAILLDLLPGITHLVWKNRAGEFTGQAWIEMESPEAAAAAVARTGEVVLGRALHIKFDPPDGKDVWPPPHSKVLK